jgi:hypothetical protein
MRALVGFAACLVAVAAVPAPAGQGSGSTVLTTSSASSPATVILDFGKEVGGTPFAAVSAGRSSGGGSSVTLRIATSETLPYLTASNGVHNNDNGKPVTFAVNGARTYTGGLRGGLRFAAIQLTTPGSRLQRQADQRGRLPRLRRVRLDGGDQHGHHLGRDLRATQWPLRHLLGRRRNLRVRGSGAPSGLRSSGACSGSPGGTRSACC